MQHNPITTKQTIKRAVLYAFMTLAVIVAAAVMVLLTLGYRFDRSDNSIERIGLVQLGSQPTGARVNIEGTNFNRTTNTKTTLPEGVYTVEMELDGYRTWRKQVPVKSGAILWLTYPRLMPKQLETQPVASIDNLVSSLASGDDSYIAVTTADDRNLNIYDISSPDDLAMTSIALDSASDFADDQPRYTVFSWDVDSDYVLVKRSVKDQKPQWLVVDRRDESVLNINSTLAINPSDVQFQPSNNRYLYAVTDGELRRVDIEDKTLSRVIASNVYDYSIHKSSVIYTAYNDKTKQRTAAVFTPGNDLPTVLETAKDGPGQYRAVMGEYYGDTFVAIASGDSLRVYTGQVDELGQNQQISQGMKLVYQTSLNSNVKDLKFKTNGRFVVADLGNGFSVYDIEMQRLTTVDGVNLSGWLDGYLTYDDSQSELSLREFDGGNERLIGEVVSNQVVTLDQRGRFIYWVERDDESGDYQLMSTALRVD